LKYDYKAELYSYVRHEFPQSVRYVHETLPRAQDEFNILEKLLVHAALPVRIDDALLVKRHPGEGIHLNYAHPDGPDEDYAVLAATRSSAQIAAPKRSAAFLKKIRAELKRLKLDYKSLHFAEISEPTA